MHDRKRHGAAAAKAHVRRELGRDRSYERLTAAAACIFLLRRRRLRRRRRPSVPPSVRSSRLQFVRRRPCVRHSALQSPLRPPGGSVDSLPLPLFHLPFFVFGDFNAVLRTFDRVKVRASHRLLQLLFDRAVFEEDIL